MTPMQPAYAQVVFDPGAAFASPAQVLTAADLSMEQKVQTLRSWEQDAAELAVAENEGMRRAPGTDDDLLHEILLALEELTDRACHGAREH